MEKEMEKEMKKEYGATDEAARLILGGWSVYAAVQVSIAFRLSIGISRSKGGFNV